MKKSFLLSSAIMLGVAFSGCGSHQASSQPTSSQSTAKHLASKSSPADLEPDGIVALSIKRHGMEQCGPSFTALDSIHRYDLESLKRHRSDGSLDGLRAKIAQVWYTVEECQYAPVKPYLTAIADARHAEGSLVRMPPLKAEPTPDDLSDGPKVVAVSSSDTPAPEVVQSEALSASEAALKELKECMATSGYPHAWQAECSMLNDQLRHAIPTPAPTVEPAVAFASCDELKEAAAKVRTILGDHDIRSTALIHIHEIAPLGRRLLISNSPLCDNEVNSPPYIEIFDAVNLADSNISPEDVLSKLDQSLSRMNALVEEAEQANDADKLAEANEYIKRLEVLKTKF